MKPTTYRSEQWLAAVRSLPCCVLCSTAGVQAAHRNEGKGAAIKVDDCASAALCPDCHREIDQGKQMTREQRRSRLDRAIVLTVIELARRGLVCAVLRPAFDRTQEPDWMDEKANAEGLQARQIAVQRIRTKRRGKGSTATPRKILPHPGIPT